jgi:integrase
MAKRRKTAIRKRCDCRDQQKCSHPWWLRIKVKGVRQRINLTGLFPKDDPELAAAKAKDMARKGEIVEGQFLRLTATAVTCRFVADRYVESRGKRKQYYLDALLKTKGVDGIAIGEKRMDDVTTADVKQVVTLWLARKRTRAGVKGGAVAERHLKQAARHFFNWSIAEGYATRTPFKTSQGVTLIKVKVTKGRTRRLEEGEADRILEAAKADPYMADFFTSIVETACRPGELRTLQWSEVRGDEIVLLATKTKDREERRVPIMPTLRAILTQRRRGPDGNDFAPDAFVFGDDTGHLMSKERLSQRWRNVCAAANVNDLHLHDLRAEGASQLSEAGVPTEQVRDALGHSSITMTNNYLRSRARTLHQAFNRRAAKQARERLRRVK